MKITIQKDIIWFGFWFVLLAHLGFFNSIVPIFSWELGDVLQFGILLVISMYALVVLYRKGALRLYTEVNLYIVVYCICILISLIYTIRSGQAEFTHALRYSFSYFAIVFVYPLLYLKTKNIAWDRFIDSIMNVTFFMTIVKVGNCVVYDMSGYEIFSELLAGQVRNEHSTSVCSALDMLMVIWFAYRILNSNRKERKLYIIQFLWGIIYIIRFNGSRMTILSVLLSITAIWLTKDKQIKKRFYSILVLTVGIFFLIMTPYFQNIIKTLADMNIQDVESGRFDNTASVRLYTISEVNDNLEGNIFGMGMVAYGTEEFEKVFSMGSNDDLGFLGNYFTFGVCAIPIIFLLIWMCVRNIKRESMQQNKCLVWGIVVFLLVTGVSLSIFDLSRVAGLPFVLSLIENGENSKGIKVKF